MGEAFIQWVIEDRFIAGRPAWEKVGAELVESVLPYEEAKIRILNATHSCIAWAGTLVGLTLHPRRHARPRHPPVRVRLRDRRRDPLPVAESARSRTLSRCRARTLRQSVYSGHQSTRRRRRLFEAAWLHRADARRMFRRASATPARRRCCRLCSSASWNAGRHGRLPYAYQDGVMDERVARGFFAAPDPSQAFARARCCGAAWRRRRSWNAAIRRGARARRRLARQTCG